MSYLYEDNFYFDVVYYGFRVQKLGEAPVVYLFYSTSTYQISTRSATGSLVLRTLQVLLVPVLQNPNRVRNVKMTSVFGHHQSSKIRLVNKRKVHL
jgi:hypothetical protein